MKKKFCRYFTTNLCYLNYIEEKKTLYNKWDDNKFYRMLLFTATHITFHHVVRNKWYFVVLSDLRKQLVSRSRCVIQYAIDKILQKIYFKICLKQRYQHLNLYYKFKCIKKDSGYFFDIWLVVCVCVCVFVRILTCWSLNWK